MLRGSVTAVFIGLVWTTFWLLLPGGMANMAPVFAAKLLPGFDAPVDCGKTFRGQRVFGDHKTFRGLLAGAIAGAATLAAQTALARSVPGLSGLSPIQLSGLQAIAWGSLLGLGALTGDLLKSFLKRQARIVPGMPWVPWDQVDWILGTLAVIRILTPIPATVAITALALGLALHLLVKWVGYVLGINQSRL